MFTPIQNRDKTGLTFATQPNGTGITLYNASGAAIDKGDCFMIAYTGTAGQEHQTAALATNTIVGKLRVAVALEDIATAKIGYFAVNGEVVDCLVLGHASISAAGVPLKGQDATETLMLDHATVSTAKCVAYSMEANIVTTANTLMKVLLLDNRAATL